MEKNLFVMDKKLIIAPSPHIHSKESTAGLMSDVIIALLPALAVSVIFYGINTLILTAVSVVSCMVFEWVITKFLLKRKSTLLDYSAALTGLLLALNIPSTLPLWILVIGALVAIGVGKMSFGGLGSNPFNPALVGRVFLLISFPVDMTTFTTTKAVDALSGATPLAFIKEAVAKGTPISEVMGYFSYSDMLVGDRAGSMGEIGALALLIGFVYLLVRKVITWRIPIYILGTMFLFSGVLWCVNSEVYLNPVFQILSGGAILGAVYMATDYVTSPMNNKGVMVYGIGIGLITILIRVWGAYPEGISFAILIMNAVVPLINKYTKPRRFGVVSKKTVTA